MTNNDKTIIHSRDKFIDWLTNSVYEIAADYQDNCSDDELLTAKGVTEHLKKKLIEKMN